jgi:hypothetical protein
MAIQRDNNPSSEFADAVLPRAESGSDLPRWLVVFGAAAAITLFVALLRYAIDLLGVVFVIILVGFAIRTLSDWLTEGESVSAWTVSALSLGLTGTVLVGLWLFNSQGFGGGSLQDALPGPVQRAVGWMEARGWGQRVLLPESEPAAAAGSGDRPFAGAGSASSTTTAAPQDGTGAAVAMAPPRGASDRVGSASAPPRARRGPTRPVATGQATAAPRPQDAAPPPAVAPSAPPIARVATTVDLSAPASSVVGRAVRLVAVVGGAAADRVPTGQVVFTAGGTTLGRAPLRRGTATLVTLSLEIGDHQLGAAYEGDDWHLPSAATRVGHAVRRQ